MIEVASAFQQKSLDQETDIIQRKKQSWVRTYYWWRQSFNTRASDRHDQTTERVLPFAHSANFATMLSHSLSAWAFILLRRASICPHISFSINYISIKYHIVIHTVIVIHTLNPKPSRHFRGSERASRSSKKHIRDQTTDGKTRDKHKSKSVK
jgi:hypothetical protein